MTEDEREDLRARQREGYHARRQAIIDRMGGRCVNCGSVERLEFHHRNPRTKVTHRLPCIHRRKRRNEMRKCDLLCHWCHKLQTAAQKAKDPSRYRAHLARRRELSVSRQQASA